MTAQAQLLRTFVLDFLAEIGAEVREREGVYTVEFPPGKKRRFGRARSFTFDPERRKEQVELLEPGSPFLKMLVQEAQGFGVFGAVGRDDVPAGTCVYAVQFDAYSSARRRTGFAWAQLDPAGQRTMVGDGLPAGFEEPVQEAELDREDIERLRDGYKTVLPALEQAGREFSREAVRESVDGFRQALSRVDQYYQGMKQDTYLEEARIRKRLGEIQSKLYFTEDGLRELKLQKEAERLQAELHQLKKQNTERSQTQSEDRIRHEEQQRRRYEPKLRIRLLMAAVVRAPVKAGVKRVSPPEPVLKNE